MYVVICGIILVDALFGEWFQWLRVDRRPICVKKKKLFKKHLYYCGRRTGVAPAWVSIHALLPCRPILIQCCANTFTVQGGLYEILTVTIQIKTNDWYIPDCDAPLFYIWAVQGASACNFWICGNEVQKVDHENGQFKLCSPFTIKYTEGNLFKIFTGLLSSFAVRAAFNLKNSAN